MNVEKEISVAPKDDDTYSLEFTGAFLRMLSKASKHMIPGEEYTLAELEKLGDSNNE